MTRMVRELKLSVQEEFVIVNKIRKWKQIGSIPDIIRKHDSDKDSVSLWLSYFSVVICNTKTENSHSLRDGLISHWTNPYDY